MRTKEVVKLLPKIYQWNAYNLSMSIWIKAQLQLFPTITLDVAINNYYKFTGITEEEWDRMAIRMQYNRMQHEFYEDLKSDTKIDNGKTDT